jgi:Negative regulator of sigma F
VNPETFYRIRTAARAEFARAHTPRPWAHDALLLAGINCALTIAYAAVRPPGFIGNVAPSAMFVAVAVSVAAVGVLGAMAAVWPGRRAKLMSALVLVAIAAAAVVSGGSGAEDARSFPAAGIFCVRAELVWAATPTIAALAVLSRFAYSTTRTLVGGLAAGATGLLALHLHCRIGTASHLAMFHVLPWVAVAGISVFIRSRIQSRSFAP